VQFLQHRPNRFGSFTRYRGSGGRRSEGINGTRDAKLGMTQDMTILNNDFFSHTLDAVHSDPAGIFGISVAVVTEPAMLLDFLLFLESGQFGSLVQQFEQLQS